MCDVVYAEVGVNVRYLLSIVNKILCWGSRIQLHKLWAVGGREDRKWIEVDKERMLNNFLPLVRGFEEWICWKNLCSISRGGREMI